MKRLSPGCQKRSTHWMMTRQFKLLVDVLMLLAAETGDCFKSRFEPWEQPKCRERRKAELTAAVPMEPWLSQLSPDLFWDVAQDSIDPDKNMRWLVERVLVRGRWEDWLLLKDHLPSEGLAELVTQLKLSAGEAHFSPRNPPRPTSPLTPLLVRAPAGFSTLFQAAPFGSILEPLCKKSVLQ